MGGSISQFNVIRFRSEFNKNFTILNDGALSTVFSKNPLQRNSLKHFPGVRLRSPFTMSFVPESTDYGYLNNGLCGNDTV